MKSFIRILWLVLAILVTSIIGYITIFKSDILKAASVETYSSTVISDKLNDIAELSTYKYEFTDVIISKTKKQVAGYDLPMSEAVKLIRYQGYIKVGSDLSKINITSDSQTKSIKVKVAKSVVLDNVVDTNRTIVEDLKGEILSDYPSQLLIEDINKAKQELQEKIIKDGLLEKSDKRLVLLIESYLKGHGYDKIEFEFI